MKCMECGGVWTIVEILYLHEMPHCSMIHFFKWVETIFKVPYALSSDIQQRKEKEADCYHFWVSTISARIYKYRLLLLDLWLVVWWYMNSSVWIIFRLLLLILVIPTVHTRWNISIFKSYVIFWRMWQKVFKQKPWGNWKLLRDQKTFLKMTEK